MPNSPSRFPQFFFRVSACHMVTYVAAGLLAYTIFDYQAFFREPPLAAYMKPTSSPWVAAGPGLQIIRGLIFAVVLYPFRAVFLDRPKGWLALWGLFVGLAILSTAGPAPGSVEGFVYTTLTPMQHLRGLPEVLLQTLLTSVLLVSWYRAPGRAWNWGMGAGAILVILMSVMALAIPRPETFR